MEMSKYADEEYKQPSQDDTGSVSQSDSWIDVNDKKKDKKVQQKTESHVVVVQEEKNESFIHYQGQYRPIFQFIPRIPGVGLVANEKAKIAFSNDCYIEEKSFCGLRRGRVLAITPEGYCAIGDLIRRVGLQDTLDKRLEIRDSVFHYNTHLWDGMEHKRIPFAHEDPIPERELEDIHERASLIAIMFYFDTCDYYRSRIDQIYINASDTLVRTFIYKIARGIYSKLSVLPDLVDIFSSTDCRSTI